MKNSISELTDNQLGTLYNLVALFFEDGNPSPEGEKEMEEIQNSIQEEIFKRYPGAKQTYKSEPLKEGTFIHHGWLQEHDYYSEDMGYEYH